MKSPSDIVFYFLFSGLETRFLASPRWDGKQKVVQIKRTSNVAFGERVPQHC